MKQIRERKGTKEKIRECAISLFKENGFDNVTVAQICKAVDISKRTFYYHFESKEAILDGIVGHVGYQTQQLMDALIHEETNVGSLWGMMKGYALDAESNGPAITERVFYNVLQGKETAQFPQEMVLFKTATRTIANAQNAGEISNPAPPEQIAFCLYQALRGTAFTWCSQGGQYSLLKEYRQVFEALLGIQISRELAFGEDAHL